MVLCRENVHVNVTLMSSLNRNMVNNIVQEKMLM